MSGIQQGTNVPKCNLAHTPQKNLYKILTEAGAIDQPVFKKESEEKGKTALQHGGIRAD